ncbi:hypothetical protein [Vibrio tetraodonis]|uniref:hypothetical protein n=1 Tax=Vibrio tetraodonis TaxID=2231647 RepID=UPI000E0B3930|nr:hypothetical protein [Vibrio tetraodonis]
MSYIIPPPIKIEFPEQLALSDSIGGSRSDVAASELAVKLLADQMRTLGTTNLLINPRGKINQASETDGEIEAGEYFCDGWKAGPNGAHVYRLDDGGFDLRGGSIVQLIPNDLEVSRLVRTNLDVVSGSPMMKVNGIAEKAAAGDGEYIEIEISGDNSTFNRLIAASSQTKPVYQHDTNELGKCQRFYFDTGRVHGGTFGSVYTTSHTYANFMHAVVPQNMTSASLWFEVVVGPVMASVSHIWSVQSISNGYASMRNSGGPISVSGDHYYRLILDARP